MWISQFTAVVIAFLSLYCSLVEPTPTANKRQGLHPRQDQPPICGRPLEVKITNFNYFGDGCSPGFGDIQIGFTPDPHNIQLNYTNTTAWTGPTTPASSSNITCNVSFTLEYTPGWGFRVSEAIWTGWVHLQVSIPDSRRDSSYQWGDLPKTSFGNTWSNNAWDTVVLSDQFNSSGADLSTCFTKDTHSTVFTLSNTLSLPPGARGWGSIWLLQQLLKFTWEKCPRAA